MTQLVTLTLNPTIDVSCEVEKILPTHKLCATSERHDPGGGGINVARMFVRLGGDARCIYLAGGPTGHAFDGLLDLHQIVRTKVPVRGETRMCPTLYERTSGLEYRIVPEGPQIGENEWRACLDRLRETRCDYIVASGSLPRGVPDDFYARAAAETAKNGARFILDSSGRGLSGGLSGRSVYLVKPSLDELSSLAGRVLADDDEVAKAAMEIVRKG